MTTEVECHSPFTPDLGAVLSTATGLDCIAPPHLRPRVPSVHVVSGRPGTGKTRAAIDAALNWIRGGGAVSVMDVGGGFDVLSRLIGGTTCRVQSNGKGNEERLGGSPLFVWELEDAVHAGTSLTRLPHPPVIGFPASGSKSLLVVDELDTVLGVLPTLPQLLAMATELGGSVLLCTRSDATSPSLQPIRDLPLPGSIRSTFQQLHTGRAFFTRLQK